MSDIKMTKKNCATNSTPLQCTVLYGTITGIGHEIFQLTQSSRIWKFSFKTIYLLSVMFMGHESARVSLYRYVCNGNRETNVYLYVCEFGCIQSNTCMKSVLTTHDILMAKQIKQQSNNPSQHHTIYNNNNNKQIFLC